jgi:7 transmembrane helices usually fused to an inactive transglutaminase
MSHSSPQEPLQMSAEGPAASVRARRWLFAVLFVVPLSLMLGKLPIFPTAPLFNAWFSLVDIPAHMHGHVEFILFVPLSAVVVSFFRLTLGVPVLSLFRPILVAVAFRTIGIPLGLAFLAVVLGAVFLMRPLLRGAHYYSRVPVLLSVVAVFLVVPLFLGRFWHEEWLRQLAYFPVISLCLIGESFTKTLDRKGPAAAVWPTLNTVLIGMLISVAAGIHGALHLLLRFPELLILQPGVVLLIGEFLHLELLKGRSLLPRAFSSVVNAPAPATPAPPSLQLAATLSPPAELGGLVP